MNTNMDVTEQLKQKLIVFEDNCKIPNTERQENETDDEYVRRLEGVFVKMEKNIMNLKNVIESKNEINQLFEQCEVTDKEMKRSYNQTISDMLNVLKTKLSRDEYLRMKADWDKKRKPFESEEERKQRECEEILEEVKEQREMLATERNTLEQTRKETRDLLEELTRMQIPIFVLCVRARVVR